MKHLLSKNRIAKLKKTADGDMLRALSMAEKFRQYSRQKDKRAKQKPKKYLKSTDYLSSEQFARILTILANPKGHRAELNEMLIIFAAETGLRPSEVVKVKLINLPTYHGKPEIEVVSGKGSKDRTVGISQYLVKKLTEYVHNHHKGHAHNTHLFLSEQGTQLSYGSFNAKVKKIGRKAGIWLKEDGRSRLAPHKFRHTFATLLLDVTDNEFLIQNQLGHEEPATTAIYTRTLGEKLRYAMDRYHKRLFEHYNPVLFENL